MNELINQVIYFVGFLGVGYLIGFALKKVIKIALIASGILLAGLFALQWFGYINLQEDKILADATTLVNQTSQEIIPMINENNANFNPIVLIGLGIGAIIGFVKTS